MSRKLETSSLCAPNSIRRRNALKKRSRSTVTLMIPSDKRVVSLGADSALWGNLIVNGLARLSVKHWGYISEWVLCKAKQIAFTVLEVSLLLVTNTMRLLFLLNLPVHSIAGLANL